MGKKPYKSRYKKKLYIPINENKYIFSKHNLGAQDTKYPLMRSSWEYKFATYCDISPSIIKWSSEPFDIKYTNPIDNKEHRYYIDFYIEVKTNSDNIEKFLVEIKPFKETVKPSTKLSEANYKKALETYITNLSKWEAAKKFASKNNMKFIILTEYELGLKK